MKTKYAFLPAVLIVVFTLLLFGQHKHGGTTKPGMKQHDMSRMMGKPTVDAKVKGLHLKVWVMTQKEHKKKMGKMMMHGEREGAAGKMNMMGMKHDGMEMDSATKEVMMSGTHCIMLDATDAASGKEIAGASAKVLIVSPSKMQSSFDLKPMMSHFGYGLTLSEKGKYQLTVSVNVDGVTRNRKFKYLVK